LSYTKLLNFIQSYLTENFLDLGTSFTKVTHLFCSKLTLVCKIIINLITETKITNRVDWKGIDDVYFYEPGGSATKNILHWVQLYTSKEYKQYDYGENENLKIYGQKTPPKYQSENWSKWSIPSFITFSDGDPFSTDKDTQFFLDKVDSKENFIFKKLKNYNHLDYLWSQDAYEDIYLDLIAFLK
jgi:lysosomal acid lipase/cholesteryl ester hydrolase